MHRNLAIYITGIASIIGLTSNAQGEKPSPEATTVVLVHGSFADSSSWDGIISKLTERGYTVVAVANPLRSLRSDSNYVSGVLKTISGPLVLVGHSYGGSVITNAARGHSNVKALVYVDGTAPDDGESTAGLAARFPGGTLEAALAPPVPLPDGGKDLYITREKYRAQFAADVSPAQASLMWSTQRPVTEAALNEASGPPAWKTIPSWFIFGELDKNIPPAAHRFMASRAGAKETVDVSGASHVVMISHPDAVAQLIEHAALSTTVKETVMNELAPSTGQMNTSGPPVDGFKPAPVIPLTSEAPARLIADSPLPDELARGYVVIRYRTQNLRIMPVFGPAAKGVSPRIGHLHITVDDLPWHWLDASGEPISINGLEPGPHKILLELEDPTH